MEDLESASFVLGIADAFKKNCPSLTTFEAMTLALKFHKNICILAAAPIAISLDGEEDGENDLTSQN
jgi:hypothetical protein